MKKKKLSEETKKQLIENGFQTDQLERFLSERGTTLVQFEQAAEILKNLFAAPAVIVVIGSAGVGKTSTINAVFGVDWKVGVGERGTTFAQEAVFEIDAIHKVKIIDLPGIGDSIERDKETAELYKKILPTADVVLYIVQADDRAFTDVEYSIKEYVLPNVSDVSRLVIGINKVDQLGQGTNEDIFWDEDFNYPSPAQMEYIEKKSYQTAKHIAKATGIKILWFTKKKINKKRIVAYSASKRYNLGELIRVICDAAGENSYKIPIQPANPLELMSEKAKQALEEAKKKAQNDQN